MSDILLIRGGRVIDPSEEIDKTADLMIKGLSEATEDIHVEPGETKSVTFNIIKDSAGFFPVTLAGMNGRFVVEMDWREGES